VFCLRIRIKATLMRCLSVIALADRPLHALQALHGMRSSGACLSPANGGTSCTRSSCGAAAPSHSKRCVASSGQVHSNGQSALRHNHAPMDKGCDSAHAPSWPLAMCRRARHASLQRTAWAEHGAKQPRLIGTGRSAWHVLVIGTISPSGKPNFDIGPTACLLGVITSISGANS
jgi:hypothetical protein